jgi:formate/nitrite transporter FocA (FNT family)
MASASQQPQEDPSKKDQPSQAGESELQKDHDEPKKPYGQILAEEIEEGLHEIERPPLGLFLSSFSAGLDIGFSLFLMAVMMTVVGDELPKPVRELLVASTYGIGFIMVVIGRSELFTEHTTLAVLPVIGRKANVGGLLRLWVIVYVANILGTAAFAGMTVLVGPRLKVIDPKVLGEIAGGATHHPALTILFSAILAGWLMGLLSWLVTAARDTISQILIVWLITGAIGLGHLHHSIVGATEVLSGLFAGQGISWRDFGHFMLWATIGNAIGGIFFVAVLKYSHASRGEPD